MAGLRSSPPGSRSRSYTPRDATTERFTTEADTSACGTISVTSSTSGGDTGGDTGGSTGGDTGGDTGGSTGFTCTSVVSNFLTELRQFDQDNSGQLSSTEAQAARDAFNNGQISLQTKDALVYAANNNCTFDPGSTSGGGGGGDTGTGGTGGSQQLPYIGSPSLDNPRFLGALAAGGLGLVVLTQN